MKLITLLETTGPAGWKKNYEARIDIEPSYSKQMKNAYNLSTDEKKAAYKGAKVKFEELKKAHETEFLFKTIDDAKEYLTKMEYPNWPIVVYNTKDRIIKVRGDKVSTDSFKEAGLDDIQVKDLGNGRVEVSVNASTGPMLNVIKSTVSYAFEDKKKVFNKLGRRVDRGLDFWNSFKSNAAIIEATKEEVESYLQKSKDSHNEDNEYKKSREEAKAKEPELKKQRKEKRDAEKKARLEMLIEKYGAKAAKLVTIKNAYDPDGMFGWILQVKDVGGTSIRAIKKDLNKPDAEKEQEALIAKLSKVFESTDPALKWCMDHMINVLYEEYLALKLKNGKINGTKVLISGKKNTITKLPHAFGKVVSFEVTDTDITTFENFPEESTLIAVSRPKITSLSGIHEHVKKATNLILGGNITHSILGLLKIEGLSSAHYSGNNISAHEAFAIISKHIGQGQQGLIKAQRELIEADLEDYAEL